jgi:hypothetical protein
MPKAFVLMNAELESENSHVNNLKKLLDSLSLSELRRVYHRGTSRSIHDGKMKETITWKLNDPNFTGRNKP